jgi:hypothetical protein
MVLPVFVVSTTDSEGVLCVLTIGTYSYYWNEICKELVTTRLTEYSKTAFAIYSKPSYYASNSFREIIA